MRKIMLLLLFLFNTFFISAQINIGEEGGLTNDNIPLNSNYGFNYSQQIITAEEYLAAGGVAGNITAIRYFATGDIGDNFVNSNLLQVWMGATNITNFETRDSWISVNEMTSVFNGEIETSADAIDITFSTPFNWDGTSNIVITVREVVPNYKRITNYKSYEPSSTESRGLFYSNDSTIPEIENLPQGTRLRTVPIVLFTGAHLNCMFPKGLQISNLAIYSVSLEWIENSSEVLQYELRTSGDAGSGEQGLVETGNIEPGLSQKEFTNLTPFTDYTVYLRTSCGENEFSSWKSKSFKTLHFGQIGNEIATTTFLPISTNYSYNYSQQLYLASEIQEAIGNNNNKITSIKFHFKILNETSDYKDWKVFIGNTQQSEFHDRTIYDWVSPSSLQEVFDGEITFPNPTDDWFEITFDTPFIWDGVSNIVIAVNEYTEGYKIGGEFRKIETSTNRGLYYRNDYINPNLSNLPIPVGEVKHVPQVIFGTEVLSSCEPPLIIGLNYVGSTSIKLDYNIIGTNQPLGIEYYLSTNENEPSSTTNGEVVPNFLSKELLLENLDNGQQYYIWFRSICNGDSQGEWTRYSFKTIELGQIGTGEDIGSTMPIKSSNNYNYTQQIYLADEVLQAIGENHYVKKIKFFYKGTGFASNYNNWKIFIGNTDKTNFESTESVNWISTNSMQEVYDGIITFRNSNSNTEGDWFEIELQNPFLWDGISNIVVAVNEYAPDNTDGVGFKTFKTSDFRGIRYDSWRDFEIFELPNAVAISNNIPQIVFVSEEVPSCLGPVMINYYNLSDMTVDISWNNPLSTGQRVEYYYSTSLLAPNYTTEASGSVDFPATSVNITTGLIPDTEYYVWFRTVCNDTENSDWSRDPIEFKTLLPGQIGVGNHVNNNLPTSARSHYNYTQQIYLNDEVALAVRDGRYVKKIKFHYEGNIDIDKFKDWKIFMANTAVNKFGDSEDDELVPIPLNEFLEVFDGVVPLANPLNDWFEIVLQTPFLWNGTDNIVVAVNEYSHSFQYGKADFQSFKTDEIRGLSYKERNNIDLNDLPSTNYGYKYVPKIALGIEPMPECLMPINVSVSDVSIYSANINWRSLTNSTVMGYEYEIRKSGDPGSGNTGLAKRGSAASGVFTLTVDELEPSTDYNVYMRSKCSTTSFSEWTYVVKFTTECFYPEFTVENQSICGTGNVTLRVLEGIEKIRWFDSETSSEILSEGTTFETPLLTETKSYWVETYTGTIMTPGCVSLRREVVVTVNPAPIIELSNTNFEICEGETTSVVTITAGASDYDTYTWSPAEGVSGDNTIGWTFNPSRTTVYVLTVNQSGGDKCKSSTEVKIKVKPLPVVTLNTEEDDVILCFGDIKKFETSFEDELTIVIGEGTGLSAEFDNLTAFNNRHSAGKSQLIYTANELIEAGYTLGEIKSISFNIASLGSFATNNDYTVRIAPTTLTEFEGTLFETNDFTTVYGPSTYTHTESGWQEIVFTTPFTWDGISNLIIEIYHLGADDIDNASTYYTETLENTLMYSQYNTDTGIISNKRYDIKLKINADYQVNWIPAANLYTDEEATIPYVEGENIYEVFYKAAVEGNENVQLIVNPNSACPLVKDYDIRTVLMTEVVADENQVFCGETKLSDIVVSGQEGAIFKWYLQETEGEPLADDTILEQTSYYVTQMLGNCEFPTRKRIDVILNTKPVAPITADRNFCGNARLSDLVVNYDQDNTLHWFNADKTPILGDIELQTGVYYVSQNNGVCESDTFAFTINVNPEVKDPIAEDQSFCGEAYISNIIVNALPGAKLNWYDSEISLTTLNSDVVLSEGYYFVSQSLKGCESGRVRIYVKINNAISAPIVKNQNICSDSATVADLQVEAAEGAIVKWYNVANGGNPLNINQSVSTGVYYVSQSIEGCETVRVRVQVNVVNNTAPNVDDQEFCGPTKVSEIRVSTTRDMLIKWYKEEDSTIPMNSEDVFETGIYYVSQTRLGCESPRKAVEVIINELPLTPTGQELQIFEEGKLISDIVMDQPNIIWYGSLSDAKKDRYRLRNDLSLVGGYTYYGVLESIQGCFSTPFAVTINLTLGINDFDITKLNYYPNPVQDVLTISYRDVINRVEVYSLNGQKIFETNSASNQINVDMSQFASATYIIKIFSADTYQSFKVVKE